MKPQTYPINYVRLIIFLSCLLFLFYACSPDRTTKTLEISLSPTIDHSPLQVLDSLNEMRDYNEAICYAKEFLDKDDLKFSTRSNILLRLYRSYAYDKKETEAKEIFKRIETLAFNNSSSPKDSKISLVDLYQNKAKILQDKGEFNESNKFLVRVDSILGADVSDQRVYNQVLYTKSAYYNYDFGLAKKFISTAEDYVNRGDISIENKNLVDNWYSILLEIDGDYEESIKRNQTILSRLKSIPKPNLKELDVLSYTYQNLGYIFSAKKELKEALNSYFRALEVEQRKNRLDSLSMAMLLNNLAFSHMTRKEFHEGIRNLNTSRHLLEMAEINSDIVRTKIESNLHLGYCYTEIGKHDSSIVYAHKALEMQEKIPVDLDYTYFLISGANFKKNLYKEALDTVKLSIKYAHESYGERHRLVGRSYVLLGRILRRQGKNKKALEAFQKALIAYSRNFSDPDFQENPDLKDITSQKGVLHTLENKNRTLLMLLKEESENQQLMQAAINTNKLSIQLIGELRKDYLHDYSKFHLLSQAMPTYEMGLRTAILQDSSRTNPNILGEAFRISEQGKSMILQDNLRSANALIDSDVPDHLIRKEDSLRSNIAFYGRRINLFESREKLNSYDSVQFESSKRIHLESEEAYSDFIRFLEENFPQYADRKKSLKEKSLTEIFHYLDSASLSMLEYFWGREAIYAFRLHKGEIRMYEIEKDSSLLKDVEQFRNQVSDANEVYNRGNSREAFESYKTTGYRIYQRLLEPLLADMEENRDLVIIPDGPLNVFPFEALPYQEEDESRSFRELNYLIQRHQIHYALSADLLLKGYSDKGNNNEFLGYAPTYEGARKLDFNTQEVNQIASLVNGEAIIGASANKASFTKSAYNGRFLHMAQHAIKAEDPMMSHLLFSKDENEGDTIVTGEDPQKLFAYEIYNQRIKCELAVLNACETGEGKMAQGEGMLSLSRAFRHAGAGSVIMNKWAVNDESSYRILSEFYKYLKEGESTASALRNAKLYYLNNSNKAHPYFWAGSALIGSSSELSFSEGNVFNLNSQEELYIFILICCLGMAFFMGIFYRIQRKRRDRAALFEEL